MDIDTLKETILFAKKVCLANIAKLRDEGIDLNSPEYQILLMELELYNYALKE